MSYSIFEYKEFAACNFLGGNTDSFEIRILEDGTIEYRKADFDDNTLEYTVYKMSLGAVEKIKKAIENNCEVFNVNSKLDNGTLDGNGNEFWFASEKRNRQILAWNIQESIKDNSDSDNYDTENAEELKWHVESIKQEKIVLKLFFEISAILKEENFELSLYEFKTKNQGKNLK